MDSNLKICVLSSAVSNRSNVQTNKITEFLLNTVHVVPSQSEMEKKNKEIVEERKERKNG